MNGSFRTDAVLIYPPFIGYFAGPPLGIASLEAALKERNYSARAWDINCEFAKYVAAEARPAELLARLEARFDELQARPWLDYYGQKETYQLGKALKKLTPIVRAIGSGTGTGTGTGTGSEIVGDHDRNIPLTYLQHLTVMDAYAQSGVPFQNAYMADLSARDALRIVREADLGMLGHYVREKVLPKIIEARPRILGLSLLAEPQLLPSLLLAQLVKEYSPDTYVVFGGSYISAVKDKVGRYAPFHPIVDAFSCFEGETALIVLLKQLRGEPSLSLGLPNLAVFNGDNYEWSDRIHTEDIEKLPAPSFDSMDMSIYCHALEQVPIPLITTKGCSYGKCTYCTYVYQEPVGREQSIDKVISDVRTLKSRYGVRVFSMKDSLMTAERATQIASRFIAEGIDVDWNFQSKVSNNFTKEAVALLERSGCKTIEFGLETPNSRLQELIKKRASPQLVERLLDAFAGSKITVIFNMIYGLPTETLEEAAGSLEWVSGVAARHARVRFASVNHMLGVARNSAFYHQPGDFGIDLIGEGDFAADAEWVTPRWHKHFERRISMVLHSSEDKSAAKEQSIALADARYPLHQLKTRVAHAGEEIERHRLMHRLLRVQAEARVAKDTQWIFPAGDRLEAAERSSVR